LFELTHLLTQTVSSIGTFIYAMTCHPLAQKKAQEEIDSIIGNQRLPTYEDRASLPYIDALFREVMRWRPVLPLGIPHAATKDDIYEGYFIPKGQNISQYSQRG
jgi:cytochrome P450